MKIVTLLSPWVTTSVLLSSLLMVSSIQVREPENESEPTPTISPTVETRDNGMAVGEAPIEASSGTLGTPLFQVTSEAEYSTIKPIVDAIFPENHKPNFTASPYVGTIETPPLLGNFNKYQQAYKEYYAQKNEFINSKPIKFEDDSAKNKYITATNGLSAYGDETQAGSDVNLSRNKPFPYAYSELQNYVKPTEAEQGFDTGYKGDENIDVGGNGYRAVGIDAGGIGGYNAGGIDTGGIGGYKAGGSFDTDGIDGYNAGGIDTGGIGGYKAGGSFDTDGIDGYNAGGIDTGAIDGFKTGNFNTGVGGNGFSLFSSPMTSFFSSFARGPGPYHHKPKTEVAEGEGGKNKAWKKTLRFLSTVIPFGIFLATLTPNILQINTVEDNRPSRLRSLEENQKAEEDDPLVQLVAKFGGLEAMEDPVCEDRFFCEMSVLGKNEKSNFVERGFWYLANETPEDMAEQAGMKDLFKAIKAESCQIYDCKFKQSAESRQATQPQVVSTERTVTTKDKEAKAKSDKKELKPKKVKKFFRS